MNMIVKKKKNKTSTIPSQSVLMPKMRPVVSVIKLMETISFFTWARPPSVWTVQVRFIVSWVETNGHSPRATHAHTDHWAVGPGTLSELPAKASEQENWAKTGAQVTVSRLDVSLMLCVSQWEILSQNKDLVFRIGPTRKCVIYLHAFTAQPVRSE